MIPYLAKTILCAAIFALTYKLLLEKERMHLFNRIYLLSALAASLFIPAITLHVSSAAMPFTEDYISDLPLLEQSSIFQAIPAAHKNNYSITALQIVYAVVTIILASRFLINLAVILSRRRKNPTVPYKNSSIVLHNENLAPHSFLNFLFLNAADYKNGAVENEILLHEYAHIQQRHSYDILFVEILKIVFWFNPLIVFFRKALQLNHEFLADEAVIRSCSNIAGYQLLLISKATANKAFQLTSPFTYSITKKRLVMMTKTKSPGVAVLKQAAVILVMALSIMLFSTVTHAQNEPGVSGKRQLEVPATKQGVPTEQLDEYARIVNSMKNEKGFPSFQKISAEDKGRLETIFLAMSREQQQKQTVLFMPAPPPLARVVPTEEQIALWKTNKAYGIWVNNKRVTNSELNNYKNTDFAQVFVSKLSKNAVNYGKHYYQVDLMTTEQYEIYYKKTMETKSKYQMYIRVQKKANADTTK